MRSVTHMKRLLSHHQHPVLSVLPHIFIYVEGSYWHVYPTRQKLHLEQVQGIRYIFLFCRTKLYFILIRP